MSTKRIDLNCDLGEWKTPEHRLRDEAIMPYISSCNIACGGHIGDEYSMRTTMKMAQENYVTIGAHPGYPDRENFGRVVMDITQEKLSDSIKEQLESFLSILDKEGLALHHIKPHGALYNYAAKDKETAQTVLEVIKSVAGNIKVYLPEGFISSRIALDLGLDVVYEVFADRSYEDDLSLRSRSLEGAVLHKREEVLDQIYSMVMNGEVNTFSGDTKPITAQTICLHSDTEGAAELAKHIHTFLKNHEVAILPE
ncbi:MAG: 5-oxoprolinase subunit PxpA [Balneola sp.]|nr:MAG: 5-oxoprolinase subunit PxpA [Balneola sp.]